LQNELLYAEVDYMQKRVSLEQHLFLHCFHPKLHVVLTNISFRRWSYIVTTCT
jgi:hypothetical protein